MRHRPIPWRSALPGTRLEIEALARLFLAGHKPCQLLTDSEASEPTLAQMAASGSLGRFAYIHLATHGLIDDGVPQRSAVILTQTNVPNPLTQLLQGQPVYDGRLSVREIQRGWDLHADLVTLSACETALGRDAGGEGFVGFTQALLMSGARTICLSLWRVDDTATALLMQRFYANLLGARPGLARAMPKADALAEAKAWLRSMTQKEVTTLAASLSPNDDRSKGAVKRPPPVAQGLPQGGDDARMLIHSTGRHLCSSVILTEKTAVVSVLSARSKRYVRAPAVGHALDKLKERAQPGVYQVTDVKRHGNKRPEKWPQHRDGRADEIAVERQSSRCRVRNAADELIAIDAHQNHRHHTAHKHDQEGHHERQPALMVERVGHRRKQERKRSKDDELHHGDQVRGAQARTSGRSEAQASLRRSAPSRGRARVARGS